MLYIFWFLHQTTTTRYACKQQVGLYIFWFLHQTTTLVSPDLSASSLYIFWFLHQTTTYYRLMCFSWCCISFDSYIKPQPENCLHTSIEGCISFDSYIKPQRCQLLITRIFCCISFDSYIKPQPSKEELKKKFRCISFDSYIKPQLHHTPSCTIMVVYLLIPTSNHNRTSPFPTCLAVVYLLIPTSNHNPRCHCLGPPCVVYLLIPTSNHNRIAPLQDRQRLYIFWFLHQTTTRPCPSILPTGCISFDSYIKPQLVIVSGKSPMSCISFDSYIKPQLIRAYYLIYAVVYLLIPTSNHNRSHDWKGRTAVVYLLIPTSNHNHQKLE